MHASSLRLLVAGAITVVAAVPLPAVAADRVSGTLTQTYVIVEDTDLIGDITCNVANGAPCFSFGASGVELRFNGFSITGRGDAVTGCGGVSTGGESGVTTNGMSRVAVRGPGLVHRFRGDGVTVIGSTDARVEDLTTSTNCMSGVRIVGTSFGTLVQNVVAVRNGATMPPCGGI
jgi:hypothetical protein